MLGEAVGFFELRFVLEDRTCAGGASASAHERKFLRFLVRIPDHRRLYRWEFGQPGVVRASIDWLLFVKNLPGLTRFEIEIAVNLAAARIGPTEKRGFANLADRVEAIRPARLVVLPGVRSNIANIDNTRLVIDGETPRVAESHRVDFRPSLWSAGGEQVAFGNRVASIGSRADAVDFAS